MHVRKRLAAGAATLPFGTVTALQAFSAFDTVASKTAIVTCPAGQRVLGGGASLSPSVPG